MSSSKKSPTAPAAPRLAGRPRDEAAGPAILAAARELVAAHGYEGVTTDAIAEAAGVGKQTIYRRWPSKAHLVLDAFVAHAHSAVDHASHQSLEPAVRSFLVRTFRALEVTGMAIRSLMAHAQGDAGFREDFRTRFIGPRRAALAHVIVEAAVRDGAKITAADVDAAVIALFGALWYRLLLGEPLDADLATRLARLLSAGLLRAANPGGERDRVA
ncbi:MAG: TetR/AcrR family transcriptional regulator [Myxococcota bacterium]|nr:TetR/AcrR family transcriptional regulator [Myxococcota bacterium]